MPADQAVVIAGLDFKVLRIFALIGCVRIFAKHEFGRVVVNQLDWLFIFWILSGTIAYLILWGTTQALIYKLGVLVDTYMLYFVFRNYVRDMQDVKRAMHILVMCMIFLTPLVLIEYFSGQNPFSILGRDAVSFREGKIRCSAAFSHAILLGSFAASIVPLAIALQRAAGKKSRNAKLYLVGIVCSVIVTFASASSGPIIALLAGLVSIMAFRYRHYTGIITYASIGLLFFLHMVMKAPVWHLVSRIDISGGSTGYHRFYLIDQTIKNFGEWALIGVKGVAHWGVWAGDVTSMYIAQGVSGGFLCMVLFIWMIVLGLRILWKTSMLKIEMSHRWLCWGAFCSLLTHCLSFLSVAYFGQIIMMLTLGLVFAAMISQNKMKYLAEAKSEQNNRRVTTERTNS